MLFGEVNNLIAQWLSLILIVILYLYAVNVRGTSLFSLHLGRDRKALIAWSWVFPFSQISSALRKPNNLFSLFPTAGLGENRVSLLISKCFLLSIENKTKNILVILWEFCQVIGVEGPALVWSLRVAGSQTCPFWVFEHFFFSFTVLDYRISSTWHPFPRMFTLVSFCFPYAPIFKY